MLQAENVTVRYGQKTIVNGANFRLREGQWLMLCGPNGAGKSTLVSAISQSAPYTGRVLLAGRDIRSYSAREIARSIGVLSQVNSVNYAFTVEEVVSLGRYSHTRSLFSKGDEEGRERVRIALLETGLEPLRKHSMLSLSGGEMQRAFLAQVFAQDPSILILDEPANHLDLVYQKQLFALIREWLRSPGRAVISVVHDLSLARKYGTHAVLMNEGRMVAQGVVDDALTRENLRSVYGMDVYGWMQDMLSQWEDA